MQSILIWILQQAIYFLKMVTIDDLNCKLVLADNAVEYLRIDFNMLMESGLQDKIIEYWTNIGHLDCYKKTYILYNDEVLYEQSIQEHFTRIETDGIPPTT